MPSSTFGSLSMHSTAVPISRPRSTAATSRGAATCGAAFDSGTSTENREPRRGTETQIDLVIEHAADALHDGKPEAQTARHLGALVEPVEFLEDHLLLRAPECRGRCRRRRCADWPPRSRQPTSTRPLGVYLIALETRFCSSRRSSRRSERTVSEQGTNCSVEALLAGERRELDLELAQHVVDAEADRLRPHRAAVQPRHVEQRAEDFLDRFERGIDVADQAAVLALVLGLVLGLPWRSSSDVT